MQLTKPASTAWDTSPGNFIARTCSTCQGNIMYAALLMASSPFSRNVFCMYYGKLIMFQHAGHVVANLRIGLFWKFLPVNNKAINSADTEAAFAVIPSLDILHKCAL